MKKSRYTEAQIICSSENLFLTSNLLLLAKGRPDEL